MHLHAYLRSAEQILSSYTGELPFAAWLKNYFRENRKFGSRDRRLISDLCFCFFRLGGAFRDREMQERLLIGQFVCHDQSVFVQELKPEWKEATFLPAKEKFLFLDASQAGEVFPLKDELSSEIETDAFQLSFLQQPHLFLRIRPGKEKIVVQKLQKAGIVYSLEGTCLRLSNSTKIDDILLIDDEAVVQDISSQRVLELLQRQTPNDKRQTAAWDCCAASGGKTILLYDTFPNVRITATDIRESILLNLRNRLKRAGITSFRSFVADVAAPHFSMQGSFDIILCDAPCSGSGTWGRTPEQLQFFPKEKIGHYTALQKRIALNASRSLRPNGFFLYITCSVLQKENEDVVAFLRQNSGMQFLSQQYSSGYDKKGDTLFCALFTRL